MEDDPLKDLPEGWKMVRLGDLFTDEQMQFIFDTCLTAKDYTDIHDKLLTYFKTIRTEIEAKGLTPEYAAYAVPVWIDKAKKVIQ